MNVKKLSLASLLLMACSFAFGETFVKVTTVSQLVPGNKCLIIGYDSGEGYTSFAGLKGSVKGVPVTSSETGSSSMSLIVTAVNTYEGQNAHSHNTPAVFIIDKDENGNYTLYNTYQNSGYMQFNGQQLGYSTTEKYPWKLKEAGTTAFDNGEQDLFFLTNHDKYLYYRGGGNNGTPQFFASNQPVPVAIYVQSLGGSEVGETTITLRRSTSADAIDKDYYATAYYENNDFKMDDHMVACGITNTFSGPIQGSVPLDLTPVVTSKEVVPAGTPVLLKVKYEDVKDPTETSVSYPIYLYETKSTAKSTGFKGTDEGEETAPDYSYVLGMKDGIVVFGTTTGEIPAHRAYIQAPSGSSIKSFTINFNGETAIKEVSIPQEQEENDDAVYSLVTGQKVNKNHKGIVVNKKGKKFLNK